jgi:hypothetical protein
MRLALRGTALVAAALGLGLATAVPAEAGCVELGPPTQTWTIEQVRAAEARHAAEQTRKQIADSREKPANTASNERPSKPKPC